MKKQSSSLPNLLVLTAVLTLAFFASGCGVTGTSTTNTTQPVDSTTSQVPATKNIDSGMMAETNVQTETSVGTNMMGDGSGSMMNDTNSMGSVMLSQYKDGTYNANGNYVSPEGQESIGVTLTLQNDVIVKADAVAQAHDKNSKAFQAMFIDGFRTQVVGKKITEVHLTKVSGSSLTPKGFNDALAKIEVQAAL